MDTVSIKVKYLGLLKNTAGCDEEAVTLPKGGCVEDLFQLLCQKHGEQFSSVMFRTNGRLRPTAQVLVGDQDIRDGEGAGTKLEGDEEISLTIGIYPAAGG